MSGTNVYEPEIRALLGTASHFFEVVALKSRIVPNCGRDLGRVKEVERPVHVHHLPRASGFKRGRGKERERESGREGGRESEREKGRERRGERGRERESPVYVHHLPHTSGFKFEGSQCIV